MKRAFKVKKSIFHQKNFFGKKKKLIINYKLSFLKGFQLPKLSQAWECAFNGYNVCISNNVYRTNAVEIYEILRTTQSSLKKNCVKILESLTVSRKSFHLNVPKVAQIRKNYLRLSGVGSMKYALLYICTYYFPKCNLQ